MATSSIGFDIFARDRASDKFEKVGRSAEKAKSRLSGLARVGGIAAKGIGVMSAALAVAGAVGIKTAADLQQAQIGFETMLGSGKKARAFLGDLQKFATKTPFQMPGLIENSRMLIGVGVEAKKVIPLLQDFGDAAGALGIKQDAFSRAMLAMSQSISAGKIKLGDMNQLMNAGLPIWQLLSQAIGKPVPEIQKLISHGELLTADVLPKLQAVMHKNYGGAMARQSQTLAGLWSTLMDTFNLGLANAIMPLVPVFQRVMPAAIGALGTALSKVPGIIENIQDFAGPIVRKIRDAKPRIQRAVGGWKTVFKNALSGVTVAIGPVIDSIKAALDGGDWGPVGKSLGEALVKAIRGMGSIVGKIGKQLGDMLGKVDWVGIGITMGKQAPALVVGLAIGLLNFDIGGLLKGLAGHWQEALLAVITVAFAPAKFIGWVGKILAKIPLVGKLLEWALLHFKSFSDGLVGMVGKALGALGRAFMVGFRRVFPGVGKGFADALKILPLRLAVMALDIQAKGLRMVRGLAAAIGRGIGSVVAKIGELIARMLKPFANAGGWLVSKGVAVVRGLLEGIRSRVGSVWAFLGGIGGKILSAVGNLSRTLWNAGTAVIQGLMDGITAKLGALKDKLSSVSNFIKDHKGPLDKDRVLLTPAGIAIMEGLIAGIESRKVKLGTVLAKLTAFIKAQGAKLADLLSKRNDLRDQFQGFTSSVFSADLSGNGAAPTSQSLVAFQQQQRDKAAQLKSDVERLLKMGLSKDLIQQLAASGESGIAQIHALAGGSASDVASLNSLNAQTQSLLAAAGLSAGNAVYGSDIQRTKEAQALAASIGKELRDWLKKHHDDSKFYVVLDNKVLHQALVKRRRDLGQPLGLG